MSNDKPAKPDRPKRKSAGKPAKKQAKKKQIVDEELLDEEAGEIVSYCST